MEYPQRNQTIREIMDVLTNPRYNPRYSTLLLVAGVVGTAAVNALFDYYFIQLVRSGSSTSTLLVYRFIERLL